MESVFFSSLRWLVGGTTIFLDDQFDVLKVCWDKKPKTNANEGESTNDTRGHKYMEAR